ALGRSSGDAGERHDYGIEELDGRLLQRIKKSCWRNLEQPVETGDSDEYPDSGVWSLQLLEG
ncbi:MAG: hypothetical protein Q9187_009330, partial [Circinaria calcarea]